MAVSHRHLRGDPRVGVYEMRDGKLSRCSWKVLESVAGDEFIG